MSFNVTSDDIVYSQTTQPTNMADKYFISKSFTNPIFDTNTSSNYTSNQIIFDTTVLSNSGQLVNYQEGIIALPIVIKVSRDDNPNWSSLVTNGISNTDFMIGLKNSHLNFLNTISINLNNQDIVQGVPLTNAYLTFIQHSEMTQDDEFLNMPLTGYSKDSSASWYYQAATLAANTTILTGDSRGVGLGNNADFGLIHSIDSNESFNEGLLKRQRLIGKNNAEKAALVGNLADDNYNYKSGVVNNAAGKYIIYDCYLRLKDICPNLFNNLPMAYGLKLKITLTLNNNVSFQFQKNAAGNFVYDYSKFSNPTSATNPIMIAASYNTFKSQGGGTVVASTIAPVNVVNNAGNYSFTINDFAANSVFVPCGSSCLEANDARTYTVSVKLGKNDISGQRPQCILYVPSYIMSPNYSLSYLSDGNRYRKVYYTELEYQTFTVPGVTGSFNTELSSSCIRPKRLIMIPILSATDNFNLNPISSPFTTEPSTTTPCMITGFNCSIANVNIFPNDITYSYDHYLQELNGGTGVNANLTNGLVSSRINLVDYQNNYGYIVCDLSRRLPEQDSVAVSIRVRGRLVSKKAIDIHCFIEREKWIEIDVSTGDLRNRG